MRSVKLVVVHGNYDRDGDYQTKIGEHVSDWEEISEEDYKILTGNSYQLQSSLVNSGHLNYGESILILSENAITIPQALLSIADIVKEQKLRDQAVEKKRLKAEATRIANATKSKAEKDRKLLAKLKAQYEPDKI